MSQKEVELTIIVPIALWRCLIAMAAQDLREPANFLLWLAYREAKQRDLLPTEEPQSRRAEAQD